MSTLWALIHIVGAVTFAVGHGSSIVIAFRLRRERSRDRIAALLDASLLGTWIMYAGLLLLLTGGIVAASVEGLWGRAWIWWSIGILVAVIAFMYVVASPYYTAMRHSAGGGRLNEAAHRNAEKYIAKHGDPVDGLAKSWQAHALATVGGLGLLAILVLMVFKPA